VEPEAPRHRFREPKARTVDRTRVRIAQGWDEEHIMMKNPVVDAVQAAIANECWVGIDVAKAHLDVATWPAVERLRVARDEAGLAELVAWLQARPPSLIVLEATGGLETPVVVALVEVHLPAAVINPRQARDFAKALGRLAKTDALDAEVLARFGQALRPEPRPWKDEETQELTALIQRRRQVVEMLTAEKNRLASAHRHVQPDIQTTIDWLQGRLKDLDDDLQRPAARQPDLAGAGRLAAKRAGHRPRHLRHPAGRLARAGHPQPASDRCLGRGVPVQPRFRSVPRSSHDLRGSGRGPGRVVHGHRGGQPLQSRDQSLLPAPAGGRQTRQGRLDRLHAQIVDDLERDAQGQDSLAVPGGVQALSLQHSCSMHGFAARAGRANRLSRRPQILSLRFMAFSAPGYADVELFYPFM
jgi:hypothetical protein